MTGNDCARAETLAGAIALNEATDQERDSYRRHISTCARCLEAYGGEREIERVMDVFARVREEESWEPDLRAALRDRSRMRRRAWQLGLSVSAFAMIASLGLHALLATAVHPPELVAAQAPPAPGSYFKVSLESRPRTVAPVTEAAPAPVPAAAAPSAALKVVHNVVTLAAPRAQERPAAPARQADRSTAVAVAGRLPSLHDERTIAALENAQSTPPALEHQAESLALAPSAIVVRDVALLGSMPAPRPPMIAAKELAAEGLDEVTTVYTVAVDERGVPTACSIEKASGLPAIDEAVCRAAMKARFSPRTINGRPIPGTFRDAYVFLPN